MEKQYGRWVEEEQDRFFLRAWDPGSFAIILCDGAPCGYLCVEDRTDDIHVRELVLLPAFQEQGIGSRLVTAVLARAGERHVPVHLETQRENRAL